MTRIQAVAAALALLALGAGLTACARGPEAAGVHTSRAHAGRALAFTVVYAAGSATSAAEVVQIQAMLRAIGIGVESKAFDPNQLFAPAQMGGVLESGTFDVDLSGYFQTDDPDDSALFSCANRAPRGANVARYCSARFEALTAQAVATPDGPPAHTTLREDRAHDRARRAVGLHLVAASAADLRHGFQRLRSRARPAVARPAELVDRNANGPPSAYAVRDVRVRPLPT